MGDGVEGFDVPKGVWMGDDVPKERVIEDAITQLARQVRSLEKENVELRADGMDSPHSNMPVKYYDEGGMTYAVYGSSSISYVEFLRQRHAEELDGVWADIAAGWSIEDRAFFEAAVKNGNGFSSALAMALHYIWKREPKVAEAVEAAFREGCFALMRAVDRYGQQTQDVDEAWLASEAKARLT